MSHTLSTAESLLLQRWQEIFRALRDGADVPPGQRLRAEGMMEAVVLLGISPSETVSAQMAVCYAQVFGQTLEQQWGEHWAQLFPFPQIPGFMQRAPVRPSTRD